MFLNSCFYFAKKNVMFKTQIANDTTFLLSQFVRIQPIKKQEKYKNTSYITGAN